MLNGKEIPVADLAAALQRESEKCGGKLMVMLSPQIDEDGDADREVIEILGESAAVNVFGVVLEQSESQEN